MKKLVVYSLAGLLTLSCSVSTPNNSSQTQVTGHGASVKEDFSALAKKYNFVELEQEYKSFSTKTLSNAYVLRMFNKFLTTGAENPTQIIRQLEFARYLKDFKSDSTYFNSLSTIVGNDTSVYTKITGITQVSQKMSSESSTFGTFVQSLSPFPGVPVTTSATNVTASGFTANWSSISNATGYILTVTQGVNSTNYPLGVVTTYNVTGLSENTTYSYTVKSTNTNGTSTASNSTSVSTLIANYAYVVSTIAGNGTDFFADGNGTNSMLNQPNGIFSDVNGNIYVTEQNNHKIRKIDSSGNVTTVAGSSAGFADGNGTNARFDVPSGIVKDSNGNLYVSDYNNSRIRKIDTAGNVTTIAGDGGNGLINANGTSARFRNPNGITIDNNGNLYVVDYNNSLIRKIDTSRNVTTFAGNGTGYADGQGTNASFLFPTGIVADGNGNLYVTDCSGHKIRKIDSSANVTTIAGGEQGITDGQGTNARFNRPFAITVYNNNLYVADIDNHKIRKIDSSGNVTTIAGSTGGFANNYGTNALFNSPAGITAGSNGNLFVSDFFNHRIRKINITTMNLLPSAPVASSPSGITSTSFTANWSSVSGATGYILTINNGIDITEYPLGVVTSYNVTTLSPSRTYSYTVKALNSNDFSIPSNSVNVTTNNSLYTVSTIAGSSSGETNGNGTSALFNLPVGITNDNNGNLYVTEQGNHRIRKIDSSGNVTTFAGSSAGAANGNGTNAQFNTPMGIVSDNNGNLYVSDYSNNKIRKIDSSGNVTTVAGSGSASSTNGQGTSASFYSPAGITRDIRGNIYVAEYNGSIIRKIDTAGNVTTFAGNGSATFADGQGTSASFKNPREMTIDNNGNLYVADYGNNRIRKIDRLGNVTTIAGSTLGIADGNGTNAQFNKPYGIVSDNDGNLYVTNGDTNRIRKIDRFGNVTTIAGSAEGTADGNGTAAMFYYPGSITRDNNGKLYVADLLGNRIRNITL